MKNKFYIPSCCTLKIVYYKTIVQQSAEKKSIYQRKNFIKTKEKRKIYYRKGRKILVFIITLSIFTPSVYNIINAWSVFIYSIFLQKEILQIINNSFLPFNQYLQL